MFDDDNSRLMGVASAARQSVIRVHKVASAIPAPLGLSATL